MSDRSVSYTVSSKIMFCLKLYKIKVDLTEEDNIAVFKFLCVDELNYFKR